MTELRFFDLFCIVKLTDYIADNVVGIVGLGFSGRVRTKLGLLVWRNVFLAEFDQFYFYRKNYIPLRKNLDSPLRPDCRTAHTRTHTHTHIHSHAHTHAHTLVHTHTPIRVYTQTHIHTYT